MPIAAARSATRREPSRRRSIRSPDPAGDGLRLLADIVAEREVRTVVVGLPVGLSGEEGEQAAETRRFVERLRSVVAVEVETYDERFTSSLARQTPGTASEHSRAAAHLLSEYLRLKTS